MNLASTLASMGHAVAHRGPDHTGQWTDAAAGIGLVHQRLAIRDLTPTGNQPMLSSCGRYVMVYNGEVYSHVEMLQELGPRSSTIRGHSDTEVMLEACAEWGVGSAVQRFIGMFAFALFDRRDRTLTLVRDRLGIKPLYWSRVGNTILFGSELKAITASNRGAMRINREALADYLTFSCFAAPATVYSNVNQIRPGTMVTIDEAGRTTEFEYWSLADAARQPRVSISDERDALDQLDSLLVDAVERRLVSDVPIGALLSGGVDSSLVTALMVEASRSTVQTFTVGFEESSFDESDQARRVAEHLKTDHHQIIARASDAMSLIDCIATTFDEPFADVSQLPSMLVAELTRKSVTVALTGDGGDELFGGYRRYAVTEVARMRARRAPHAVRRTFGSALLRTSPHALDRASQVLPSHFRREFFSEKARVVGESLAAEDLGILYLSLLGNGAGAGQIIVGGRPSTRKMRSIPILGSARATLDAMRFEDMRHYLPDDILTKVDRATMRVSLEARIPLLDHRVVEFGWTLPSESFTKEGGVKWPLRRSLYRRVPRALVDRPKMGFGVPISAWLRGPLRKWADDLLDPIAIRDRGVLDAEAVRRLWGMHLGGSEYGNRLWAILVLQMWLLENPHVS